MPFLLFDPTMIVLLPAIALALYAQMKVRSTYHRYSQVATRSGLTGAAVTRAILRDENVSGPEGRDIDLELTPGELSDHYDPRTRTLRLSQDIFYGNSIAALGIAAHEVGHAIQHARMYTPMEVRNLIYPVSSIGSALAFPLFLVGLIMASPMLLKAGIILFTVAVLFTVLTLPVEFDASRRAVRALSNGGYLTEDELAGARKVLNAAALTYVAATAMALLSLLRMVLLARMADE